MAPWLLELLCCPRHRSKLSQRGDCLSCEQHCSFPVVDQVPVFLLGEALQTMDLAKETLKAATQSCQDGGLYLATLGVSEEEKEGIRKLAASGQSPVDPVASFLVGATNGIAYKNQIGRLAAYPIPELRLPEAHAGELFLDLGCNWGRWSVAAARKGYRALGIDPSLGAVMAARRVARQLGIQAEFIVGDARFLPIRDGAIDRVFSYSVLQHLSSEHVAQVVADTERVLAAGGSSLIQMPTRLGIRCLFHQARRRFRKPNGFEVRYWSLGDLRRTFSRIGTTSFSTDCYFGIGLQYSDLHWMSPVLKVVVVTSEILRKISNVIRPMVWLADSVYVTSRKQPSQRHGTSPSGP